MKLAYSVDTCSSCFQTQPVGSKEGIITHVIYDSRKIQQAEGALFFALKGSFRDGMSFIEDAYRKGIRKFVVTENCPFQFAADSTVWKVSDPLKSMQELAHFHRKQFTGKVVAVTGSVGKTTFKEWLFHCLQGKLNVVRSPKSFNSQLGVALSLLELNEYADIAIIEAGISQPGEMAQLAKIIEPNWGVLTAIGTAHSENFENKSQLLNEKWKLFESCETIFVPSNIDTPVHSRNVVRCEPFHTSQFPSGFDGVLGTLKTLLSYLEINLNFDNIVQTLPRLALRMEIFDGINNNIIINDTYNLDKDALTEALHVQQNLNAEKKKIVVLGLADRSDELKKELEQLVGSFAVDKLYLIEENEVIPWNEISNAVVLIKAHRKRHFEQEVAKGKALKHLTYVEVNLSAVKHNLEVYKTRLSNSVKLLSMVKADAYGTGAVKVAQFLERNGVDYLGVAFADEGVTLRKNGVQLPIVVMNPDTDNIEQYVKYELEPALYSFEQLDQFVSGLILLEVEHFPVHIKFDTGMHRLGFQPSDMGKVLSIVKAQPELRVKGIYSHLADADNPDNSDFTKSQLDQFDEVVSFFRKNLVDPFIAHVLNSEGALRYPAKASDMVRIGISMYGYTENTDLRRKLLPAVQWYSKVSQVKTIPAGDTIGYGRSFKARNEIRIAIIPVGYADGFRRSLSNGCGAVFIKNQKCQVVGRVCMDMIMVAIGDLDVSFSDPVEIIGPNQTMEDFAEDMDTIPYEVLTGLSKRMQRVYIED